MPQTVRWFIRTSAVYLVLTFLAGAIFLYHNWLAGPVPRRFPVKASAIRSWPGP